MSEKYDLSYFDETRINYIFTKKEWPIDSQNTNSLFNRFRNRCQILNEEERDLFYKLALEYKWVFLNEYIDLLSELLIKIVDNYTKSAQHIYVYPIKKEEDKSKIKSADVVSYLCNAVQMRHLDKLSKKTFRVVTTISELQKKFKTKGKPFIILDDYIGSGQYADSVVKELIAEGIPKSNIIVCSLLISENGKKTLNKEGYIVEFVEEVENVIDKLTPRETKILNSIEEKFRIDENFSLGFNHSANLVSLIRTPNNTLPIFWYKTKAPFERRRVK